MRARGRRPHSRSTESRGGFAMLIHGSAFPNGDNTSKQTQAELLELIRTLRDGDRTANVTRAQRLARYSALLSETGDPQVAERGLERLIGGNDLAGIAY